MQYDIRRDAFYDVMLNNRNAVVVRGDHLLQGLTNAALGVVAWRLLDGAPADAAKEGADETTEPSSRPTWMDAAPGSLIGDAISMLVFDIGRMVQKGQPFCVTVSTDVTDDEQP
jgi:hypothetical protein